MSVHELALRYSKAFFDLATNQDELQKQLAVLEYVNKLLTQKSAALFFSSPLISQEKKEKALTKILGEDSNPLTLRFFSFLMEKGRFHYLPEMTKEFKQMVDEKLGILEGNLVTSIPVNEETKIKLKDKLEKFFHKKIKLKESFDPKLIGGGVLLIGNKRIDFSIKGRLERLKTQLTT